MTCDFTSFSTILELYQDNGQMIRTAAPFLSLIVMTQKISFYLPFIEPGKTSILMQVIELRPFVMFDYYCFPSTIQYIARQNDRIQSEDFATD